MNEAATGRFARSDQPRLLVVRARAYPVGELICTVGTGLDAMLVEQAPTALDAIEQAAREPVVLDAATDVVGHVGPGRFVHLPVDTAVRQHLDAVLQERDEEENAGAVAGGEHLFFGEGLQGPALYGPVHLAGWCQEANAGGQAPGGKGPEEAEEGNGCKKEVVGQDERQFGERRRPKQAQEPGRTQGREHAPTPSNGRIFLAPQRNVWHNFGARRRLSLLDCSRNAVALVVGE